MFYTYLIRCEDDSIYTGVTNDLSSRFDKHSSGNGAKYTRSHHPVRIECAWSSRDMSLACKLEYRIKHLKKFQKENLVNGEKLSTFFSGVVDCRRYRRVII